MLDVLNNGVLLGRPQVAVRQYEAQWRQLLADVHARPLPPCPTEGFVLPIQTDPLGSPLVSVVLTHYNRPKLLQQALESLERQTFRNFEVVLVDDGSTDAEAIKFLSELSWTWWQERGWKVLREPNRYLGAARNTGAKHARGKYILFMDDDDVAKAEQVEWMARVAELTGADVVTTGHELFSGRSMPQPHKATARYVPLGPALNNGVLKNVFGDSNMLVHRQFFIDSGGFTEEYGVGFEDYEFLAKVVTRDNHLEGCAQPLHWYRQHPGTMSLYTDLKAGQVRYLRAYLEVFSYLPRMTQNLIRYARTTFFNLGTFNERD
ncbi:IPT/TIG domain-containing protein [Paramicrosporidium saccamoebae]|uniref:IPT/TIG domain-containing protein n=1 Tax=Paramicrosporidium saccamoebae TaxID=1246581 RepID=A0A2H9TLL3_9FUNG|nr:IPT/TIG domain-containing protein [Paramicrosporidium saccamoebae]